ncbi:MAG: IS110 family transposase, partial [Acidobacteria bacterium]|nr:IS110 family transposase [Acidobacteriota bacterium]
MRYLGIDLHSNNFTVCFLEEDGTYAFEKYQLKELEAFKSLLRPADRLAVEATGNSRFFHSQVSPLVAECVVVNTRQFKVIKQSVSKTDRNDARALAQFLSKGLLPSSRMKDELHAQVNSLANTRDRLVKLRTALLNKVHAHLRAHGRESRKEAYDHPDNLRKVLREEWPASVRLELEVIAAQIQSLSEGIKRLEREICELGKRLEGRDCLVSIKGVGDYSAAVLLSIIGDINDFSDEDKLASYFGIVPKVADSNQTQRRGRITKRGSKLGRLVLVQCTLTAKRFSPYLRQYYERIKGRRGSGKALIATARKFL